MDAGVVIIRRGLLGQLTRQRPSQRPLQAVSIEMFVVVAHGISSPNGSVLLTWIQTAFDGLCYSAVRKYFCHHKGPRARSDDGRSCNQGISVPAIAHCDSSRPWKSEFRCQICLIKLMIDEKVFEVLSADVNLQPEIPRSDWEL